MHGEEIALHHNIYNHNKHNLHYNRVIAHLYTFTITVISHLDISNCWVVEFC